MSSFDVVHIGDGRPVDLTDHLAGGWGTVEVVTVEPGGTRPLDATGAEICIFVLEGEGSIVMDGHRHDLESGVGVTLTKGSAAVLRATTATKIFAANLPA
jgi:glyoxylate utilization-related uncharacterized protein